MLFIGIIAKLAQQKMVVDHGIVPVVVWASHIDGIKKISIAALALLPYLMLL